MSDSPQQYTQTHSLWIAAVVLPLVVLISGLLIAFICWRRLRNSQKASSKLANSPASFGEGSTGPPSTKSIAPSLSPPLPYPQPLFLSSTLYNAPRRPLSTDSFLSVSTKVTPQGSRVLVRKNRKNWPPEISWPIQLELYNPQSESRHDGSEVEGVDRGEARNETNLQRGISLVSGYQSQSQSHHHPYQSLVEEASKTRNSWTEGDDDPMHFSTTHQRPRARSLSSRSFSEYSTRSTIGATTLGKLLDEEIQRNQRQEQEQIDSNMSRRSTPSLASYPFLPSTRPLHLPHSHRPRTSSSADLYSILPVPAQLVPFPRLPPFPTTPSRFSSPVSFNSNHNTTIPPSSPPFQGQRQRQRGTSENTSSEGLVAWRRAKSEERRRERDQVSKGYDEGW